MYSACLVTRPRSVNQNHGDLYERLHLLGELPRRSDLATPPSSKLPAVFPRSWQSCSLSLVFPEFSGSLVALLLAILRAAITTSFRIILRNHITNLSCSHPTPTTSFNLTIASSKLLEHCFQKLHTQLRGILIEYMQPEQISAGRYCPHHT